MSLGEQLVARADVDRVVTIGRASAAEALHGSVASCDHRLSYASISVGDETRPAESAHDAWEHLPTIERDIGRALRAAGPLDMVHLRMADVGTLAAAHVADQLGLPVCFSLAPDPHHVIASMQAREGLDQQAFVRLDAEAHVWFRARLVERLAATSDRIASFPGSRSAGLIDERPQRRRGQRRAVVAEGVDVTMARQAAADVARGGTQPGIDILDELAGRIPSARRGLPIVLSVGRLHPVKGMERVIEAWADDELVWATSNLVIVGGDLADPSRTEQQVLDSIDRALPRDDPRRSGLVLLGGRPRRDIAMLMAATAAGRADDWAPGGLYVDGARKEEFGLAVLEALAAGLVVVAPSTGGPSSYVEHGVAGILVDPSDDLALAIRSGFALTERPGRSARSRAMVESTYSIATMAADLVALYA